MQAAPQKEHEWLQQLVGEWTCDGECTMGPGEPPAKMGGTEVVRSIGGLWTVAEASSTMPDGNPATTIMTLGFDPLKGGYTGTWTGSMMTYLWIYSGEMDASGKILTLNAEGPSMADDGAIGKYQDIIEILSPGHRTLKSRTQSKDGSWNDVFMTMHYHRQPK